MKTFIVSISRGGRAVFTWSGKARNVYDAHNAAVAALPDGTDPAGLEYRYRQNGVTLSPGAG